MREPLGGAEHSGAMPLPGWFRWFFHSTARNYGTSQHCSAPPKPDTRKFKRRNEVDALHEISSSSASATHTHTHTHAALVQQRHGQGFPTTEAGPTYSSFRWDPSRCILEPWHDWKDDFWQHVRVSWSWRFGPFGMFSVVGICKATRGRLQAAT